MIENGLIDEVKSFYDKGVKTKPLLNLRAKRKYSYSSLYNAAREYLYSWNNLNTQYDFTKRYDYIEGIK